MQISFHKTHNELLLQTPYYLLNIFKINVDNRHSTGNSIDYQIQMLKTTEANFT